MVTVGAIPGISGSTVSINDIYALNHVLCPEGIGVDMGRGQSPHQVAAELFFGDGAICAWKALPTGLIFLYET